VGVKVGAGDGVGLGVNVCVGVGVAVANGFGIEFTAEQEINANMSRLISRTDFLFDMFSSLKKKMTS